jgi:uncharacterized protein with HEPN domain
MTRDIRLYLQDIVDSIEKIQRYTENLTFAEFELNDMVIDAVVRNFEVIGEAAGHVPDEFHTRYPEIPWYKMKAMRNIMAHEYFRVDLEIIWRTACESLPPLVEKIKSVIMNQ